MKFKNLIIIGLILLFPIFCFAAAADYWVDNNGVVHSYQLITPTIYGGTGAGNDLTFRSTSHATKGKINFGGLATSYYDEANNKWIFGGPLLIPDGSASTPSLAFGSDPTNGWWYSSGDPGPWRLGACNQTDGGFLINKNGTMDFYGLAANGGGQGRIAIRPDELQIAIIDNGPTHQNGDIVLYAMNNVTAVIRPDLTSNSKTYGCFKVREKWTTPSKDFQPFFIQRGYPDGSSYGNWAFVTLQPDYSRLTGPNDGYSLLYLNPIPPASGGSRQLFFRLERDSVLKSEMDIQGKLNLQNGIIGDLTVSGIDTGAIVAIYPQGTTGATTYGYKAVGVNGSGTSIASAELTINNGNATLNGSNYNVVYAKHMPGAISIKIYRTTGGATQGLIGTITNPNSDGFWKLNDTGLAGGGETPESTNTTGKISVEWCQSFSEVANAPTAVANKAIVYAIDSGGGETKLMVQFPTGAAQQIPGGGNSSLGNAGSSKTIDWSTANTQDMTLNSSTCSITFSNPVAGQRYTLWLVQDATGSRVVTWVTSIRWAGGSAPTLTTTASKADAVICQYPSSTLGYMCDVDKGF